jgi:hypothetical protein
MRCASPQEYWARHVSPAVGVSGRNSEHRRHPSGIERIASNLCSWKSAFSDGCRKLIMKMNSKNAIITAVAIMLVYAPQMIQAQQPAAPKQAPAKQAPAQSKPAAQSKTQSTATKTYTPKQKFALDVVHSAVAIPQPDSQDRLRVLSTAANVAYPLEPKFAKQLSTEGLRIEQDLIRQGETPTVSMLEVGGIDCKSVESLVENIPAEKVVAAEQTLIGAISHCRSTVPTVQRLEAQAMENNQVAPRLVLSLMEAIGPQSPWSQDQFEKLFKSLPSDAKAVANEAPNFAAMYARMAPEMSVDVAKSSGLRLLTWLGKLDPEGPRNLAVNITSGTMKDILKDNYDKALEGDVMARQVAQTAGQQGEIDTPPEENVSVLSAMDAKGQDRSAELNEMEPSQRAREAAASGFANGTGGDKKLASRYFDIAYSSLNQVWDNRSQSTDAANIVQEVSEAAAQVDPVNALQRSRNLQDPTAQAIGMIAVARVVSSEQGGPEEASR